MRRVLICLKGVPIKVDKGGDMVKFGIPTVHGRIVIFLVEKRQIQLIVGTMPYTFSK